VNPDDPFAVIAEQAQRIQDIKQDHADDVAMLEKKIEERDAEIQEFKDKVAEWESYASRVSSAIDSASHEADRTRP
jgi:chromosome segregation ATPase